MLRGRWRLGSIVRDAEPAAYVDVLKLDARALQFARKPHHGGGTSLKRLRADDLRSEMHMDADRAHAGLHRHLLIQGPRLLERDAELVDVKARRNVRMRAGIDVWIDAHGDVRAHALRLSRAIDTLELPRRFRVDC